MKRAELPASVLERRAIVYVRQSTGIHGAVGSALENVTAILCGDSGVPQNTAPNACCWPEVDSGLRGALMRRRCRAQLTHKHTGVSDTAAELLAQ